MTNKTLHACLITVAWLAALAAHAEDDQLTAALAAGSANLDLRYRYEFVDLGNFDDDANASTLLFRLNYETGGWNGWTGFLEFDQVVEILSDDFNSGAGTSSASRDRYPVVADPNGSDLNQLYAQYAPNRDWQLRFGRQRIVLDDQRYVGGVVWRQNEQTYGRCLGQVSRLRGYDDLLQLCRQR